MRKSLLLVAVLGTLATSQAVMAEEAAAPAAATPTWTFPTSFTVASDYIWRGQTQTWGNPAAQFGIEADHASGAYAGFWASNVSDKWLPNATVEMDFSAGYRNSFATDFKYDLGAVYVYYPDANFNKATNGVSYKSSKLNTLELYASLGWKWFTVKGGVTPTNFYGWNVNNSGTTAAGSAAQSFYTPTQGITKGGDTKGSYYYMASASYDFPMGINLAGEVGRQTVADSTGLDWTWYKVGVTKSFDGGWAVNGFYTGTTGTNAYKDFLSFTSQAPVTKTIDDSKFVVGITKSF